MVPRVYAGRTCARPVPRAVVLVQRRSALRLAIHGRHRSAGIDCDIGQPLDRLAGRCMTCGSPSPTAATSAAPIACPRRSSVATMPSSRRTRSCHSRRSIGPRALSSSSASRSCASPGRAARPSRAAPAHPDAGGDAYTRWSRARPHADHERGRTAFARLPVGRCRASTSDRQPRLARRRGVRRDERGRFPRRSRARRDRRRARGGSHAGQGEHGRAPGVNEASIVPMARWARDTGVTLRFIEYMDVGHSNGWRLDEVVPATELLERVTAEWPAEPAEPAYRGEVAGRYRYLDGAGEFGIISSVTRPFCRDCTRARLSADGKLYTCLFAAAGRDVRAAGRFDRRGAAGVPRGHVAGSRRPLLGAPLRLDVRSAQDRDVRDGRLTAPTAIPRPQGRPFEGAHPQGYPHRNHTPPDHVDSRPRIDPMFVDKRVDPSPTWPIP